uniref:Uncharacterized protein n=1 Tax=Brassica oleracea TaxID=3712 RepID=A0A3P6F4I8_BRAOL|nr:unnamed protein product [Brassica oleracea]
MRRISNYKKLGCASTVEILLPRFWESINLKHRCELMGVDMFLFDAKESSLCKPKGEKKGPGAYYGSNSAQEIVSQDPWDFTDISHVTGRQILIRKMSKSQWICFKMVELEKSNAAGLNDQKANLEASVGPENLEGVQAGSGVTVRLVTRAGCKGSSRLEDSYS